jgi:hypothetical protein
MACKGEKYLRFKTFFLFLSLITLLISNVSFAGDELGQKMEKPSQNGRIEVIKARLVRAGLLLNISFRIQGIGNLRPPANITDIFVIEESTGKRFNVRSVSRVGALGQRRLGEGPISSVLIDNSQGEIKKNSRVTLVIDNLRQEHIVVEE